MRSITSMKVKMAITQQGCSYALDRGRFVYRARRELLEISNVNLQQHRFYKERGVDGLVDVFYKRNFSIYFNYMINF
ncbi:hypothetical protein HpEKA43_02290 [Helicobacter pylori]